MKQVLEESLFQPKAHPIPWGLLESYCQEPKRLILGGSSSRYWLFCRSFSQIDFTQLADMPIGAGRSIAEENRPHGLSYVGFLPFRQNPLNCGQPLKPIEAREHLWLKLDEYELYDRSSGLVWQGSSEGLRGSRVLAAPDSSGEDWPDWWTELIPGSTDQAYESMVAQALRDIRAGRYYQINLIRYFAAKAIVDERTRNRAAAQHLATAGGPFSAWVSMPETEILSLSPERFVRCEPRGNHSELIAEPIKGTIASHPDPERRRKLGQQLEACPKNQAELHMIVDLMRNDMYRLCDPGSLKVEDPGSLHCFPSVQHLIARISGRLRQGISLSEFLGRLLPSGSITGVPKREVTQAIAEYEGRERGYFMGNVVVWEPELGFMDTSIMIRTLWRQGAHWRYAAGSGIVAHSQPEMEREEVGVKCRVLNPR